MSVCLHEIGSTGCTHPRELRWFEDYNEIPIDQGNVHTRINICWYQCFSQVHYYYYDYQCSRNNITLISSFDWFKKLISLKMKWHKGENDPKRKPDNYAQSSQNYLKIKHHSQIKHHCCDWDCIKDHLRQQKKNPMKTMPYTLNLKPTATNIANK